METHFDGKVAQKAIIIIQDKVLILRDPRGGDEALWELPGGRLNQDETPEAGLAREIYEELGLAVTVGRVVYVTQFFQYSENRNALMIAYEAACMEENPILNIAEDEVSEVRYVDKHEYKTLPFFPEYADALDRYFG